VRVRQLISRNDAVAVEHPQQPVDVVVPDLEAHEHMALIVI
jgi:hypothetical protein